MMKRHVAPDEIKHYCDCKVSEFERSRIERDLLHCHRGAHDLGGNLSTPRADDTANTFKPRAGPNEKPRVTLQACELKQITMISDRMIRLQEHADRNLALLEEHLLWCHDCADRLEAVRASLELAIRAGGGGRGSNIDLMELSWDSLTLWPTP